jgi:hypothetical protein
VERRYATDVFLSYARGDDEPFVKRLYADLAAHGVRVWWDRVSMPSRSLTFTQEIRDAIDASARLVAVIGPDAIASDYVRAECEWAWLFGAGVVPVLRIGEYDSLPAPIAGLHTIDIRLDDDYDAGLRQLLRYLADPVPPLARIVNVPALPPHFVPRTSWVERLAGFVLTDVRGPTAVVAARQTSALQGMGGIGKSVLAAALARSIECRRAFGDGIVWITVGQTADLLANMRAVGALFGTAELYGSIDRARAQLASDLEDASALIVLDDVWNKSDIEPFQNAVGPRCRVVFTTRDRGIVDALGAQRVALDLLDVEEAKRLLATWAGADVAALPQSAIDVVEQCGRLPLALALAGAMARGGTPWDDLLHALRAAELKFLEHDLSNYPHRDILRAFSVSLDALKREDPATADLYLKLAVFKPDEAVPETAIAVLWDEDGTSRARIARKRVTTLAQKALLTVEGQAPDRRVSLHDLQHDFLRAAATDLPGLHAEFVRRYRERSPAWPLGPDGYYFTRICYHLAQAQQWADLSGLLLDQKYVNFKVQKLNPFHANLHDDFQWLENCLDASPRLSERHLLSALEVAARSYVFADRADQVTLLRTAIRGEGPTHVVLTGVGGSGKSTVVNSLWLQNFRTAVLIRAPELASHAGDPFSGCILRETLRFIDDSVAPPADAREAWDRVSQAGIRCLIVDGLEELRIRGGLPGRIPEYVPAHLRFVWTDRYTAALPEFLKAAGAVSDELGPLSIEAARLVLGHYAEALSPDLVDRLLSESRGNPLAITLMKKLLESQPATELVESLEERGVPDRLFRRIVARTPANRVSEAAWRELTSAFARENEIDWQQLRSGIENADETLDALRASALIRVEERDGHTYLRVHRDLLELMRKHFGESAPDQPPSP